MRALSSVAPSARWLDESGEGLALVELGGGGVGVVRILLKDRIEFLHG